MKNKNYIQNMPYLRNSKAYDHDFWYTWYDHDFGDTCIKWWCLQAFHSFFQNLDFFWVVSEVKGQKMSKMTNDSVFHAPYLRNHTSYDCHLWYTSVKWQYLQTFFHFFKIFIFWVVRRVKRQKLTQNSKNCSLCIISSGTIHHMIFIYGAHV